MKKALLAILLLSALDARAQLGYGPGGDEVLKIKARTLGGDWGLESDPRGRLTAGEPGTDKKLDGFSLRGGVAKFEYEAQVGGRWQGPVKAPGVAGTKGKPIDGIRMQVDRGSIRYRVAFLDGRFSDWAADGKSIARLGDAITVIEVEYQDSAKADARVEFRVFFREGGFTPWLSGEPAVGAGESPEALAIEIRGHEDLRYEVLLSNLGWRPTTLAGKTAGDVSGNSRIEAMKVFGGRSPVKYRLKVESRGWTPWCWDGVECGAVGKSLKIQGIEVRTSRE